MEGYSLRSKGLTVKRARDDGSDSEESPKKLPHDMQITFTISQPDSESEDEPDFEEELDVYMNEWRHKHPCSSRVAKVERERLRMILMYTYRKLKKDKQENITSFQSMIEEDTTDEADYFMKLDVPAQTMILSKLKVVQPLLKSSVPYRISILLSPIPDEYKAIALKKMSALESMSGGEGEYHKLKQWIDAFMTIPFHVYHQLPITLTDGIGPCNDFMLHAKECLDKAVYGLNDAKLQIMQYLGQLISNPSATGTTIAIQGPMGTGKTTLVKEGISKILQRPFSFIALGGATDSSVLEGHMITYEGSIWGKIVDVLMKCKCMNPVFYFDELDKVSNTPRGDEIIGILTHLTDTSQNDKFHDKYFSDIELDLSKAIFIFSYNDESSVNPILRDRMYTIRTDGYTTAQKVVIAKDYLTRTIQQNVNFKEGDIMIPDEILVYIIEKYTQEKGVRNLKRCIETIYTKLNLYRLMNPGVNLFQEDYTLEVRFPFTVTIPVLHKLITLPSTPPDSHRMMYI